MADAKVTALTEDTGPGSDSLVYTVDDPAGTPASRKTTLANLRKGTHPSSTTTTDNAVARYNSTAGDLQNSGLIVDDNVDITGARSLTMDGTLTVQDSGNTDSVAISHDGTDALLTFTNTEDIQFAGATTLFWLRDGLTLRISDSADTDHLQIANNGTHGTITGTNTADLQLIGFSGNFWIRDGAGLKISDSGDTDFVVFAHNGTDFNIAGTNTTDINVTGITAFNINGSAALVSGGALGTPSGGDASNLTNKITSDTLVDATNGGADDLTVIDFSVPSGVKHVIITLSGISTSGTARLSVQLGDSGGVETTGYLGSGAIVANAAATVAINSTTAFVVDAAASSAAVRRGQIFLTLMDSSTNLWAFSSTVGRSDTAAVGWGGGNKALDSALTTVRLTTGNGTDTFNAGSVNAHYVI